LVLCIPCRIYLWCAVLLKVLYLIYSEKALVVTNNSGVAAATEWYAEIYCIHF